MLNSGCPSSSPGTTETGVLPFPGDWELMGVSAVMFPAVGGQASRAPRPGAADAPVNFAYF
jgi:hypothetical protein